MFGSELLNVCIDEKQESLIFFLDHEAVLLILN